MGLSISLSGTTHRYSALSARSPKTHHSSYASSSIWMAGDSGRSGLVPGPKTSSRSQIVYFPLCWAGTSHTLGVTCL